MTIQEAVMIDGMKEAASIVTLRHIDLGLRMGDIIDTSRAVHLVHHTEIGQIVMKSADAIPIYRTGVSVGAVVHPTMCGVIVSARQLWNLLRQIS